MPWQDNSGNRGGGRGPWGQPPRSPGGGGQNNGGGRGGGDQPDLEDLLQASKQRLRRAFPRGGGGGRGPGAGGGLPLNRATGGLIAGVLVALWLFSGVYQIDPQEQGVKTTFGKYAGISGPGLHWRIPAVQGVTRVPVDKQQTAVVNGDGAAENLMLTSDRNIVDVSFTVDWKIREDLNADGAFPNAAKYIFNIEEPESMVVAVAEAAMRETIGATQLQPIITSGQAEVVNLTRLRIQQVLDQYDSGIEVLRVNMEKPEVPRAVRDAFADVIKAGNEKERMINDAQRAANQIIPVAEGDARKRIEEARAYSATVEADAIGQANRFNNIYQEYKRAPEVTRQRMYLETVESVLGPMNKVIIDKDAGSGVVPYLPLNELQKKQN